MTTRRARAMLIGIEEYKPLGKDKHLRAGRNDVLAFWKVCRRLGFDPQNIHVFTTPLLTQQDLLWAELEIRDELPEPKSEDEIKAMVKSWFPPHGERPTVFLEEATRANIMGPDGLAWIAKHVAGPGEPPVDRILTYSGHGARLENTLALCPSDVFQGDTLQNAILIDDFKKALQDVDDNLTVVLDCCFAQTAHRPSGAHRHASISAGVADKPLAVDLGELGPRVFCASGPNESSYQALLGGYWYSAFSWAMTVVLEQWRICGKHKRHSTISHNELLLRSHKLLDALSFKQTPVLLGPVSDKPVFGHGDDTEETAPGPNAPRGSGQIDPSEYGFAEYQFIEVVNNQETVLATVVATNTPDDSQGTGMVGLTEYWQIKNGSLDTGGKSSIKVRRTKAQYWYQGKPSISRTSEADLTSPVGAGWRTDNETISYHGREGFGFYINVAKDSFGEWSGKIFFVRPADSTKLLFRDTGGDGLMYQKVKDEQKTRSMCIPPFFRP